MLAAWGIVIATIDVILFLQLQLFTIVSATEMDIVCGNDGWFHSEIEDLLADIVNSVRKVYKCVYPEGKTMLKQLFRKSICVKGILLFQTGVL